MTEPTGATATTGTSATTSPTGVTGPTRETAGQADLEDGRHFVYVEEIDPAGSMTFDLAYFYSGDEATAVARERGDEAPPPNDYYIVNDNARLRALAFAPAAEISLLDWNRCCDETVSIDVDTFAALGDLPRVEGFVEVDAYRFVPPSASQYWISVEGGDIVSVEEQYLP